MFVYINGRRVWIELQAADGGGNDGSNDGNRDQTFQRLLDRNNNDGIGLAKELFTENYKYRDKNDDLKRQLADLQGKVTPEGSVVLAGDDVTAWAAYKALGKPEEVKQGLDERGQLQGKLAAQERDTLLRTVADAAGYKPAMLANLDRLAKAEGKALAFEVRDVQIDGKPVKTAFVKDGDKEAALTDYAQSNWTDFLPSLAAQGAAQAQQATGTRYLAQHAGSSNGAKPDPVGEFLQREEANRAKVKNPLLKE